MCIADSAQKAFGVKFNIRLRLPVFVASAKADKTYFEAKNDSLHHKDHRSNKLGFDSTHTTTGESL